MRKSTKKECKNCTECIAYCNMLDGNVCGLGFKVEEVVEGGYGTWNVMVRPYENNCEKIDLPKTKEDFLNLPHFKDEVRKRGRFKWRA